MRLAHWVELLLDNGLLLDNWILLNKMRLAYRTELLSDNWIQSEHLMHKSFYFEDALHTALSQERYRDIVGWQYLESFDCPKIGTSCPKQYRIARDMYAC